MVTEHTLNGFDLRHVAERCRGAVGVDEIDLIRLNISILECQAHDTFSTLTFGIGSGHVVRVRGHSDTYYLGVNLRTAGFGVLVLLHDEAGSSFA